jgi:hypothetical protein
MAKANSKKWKFIFCQRVTIVTASKKPVSIEKFNITILKEPIAREVGIEKMAAI